MVTMPSWSRCSRDVGNYLILLTSNNTARPLLTSVRFSTHLYQKQIFGDETHNPKALQNDILAMGYVRPLCETGG
jgi:hypothetical protein